MIELTHHDYEAASIRSQNAQEQQEFNIFSMLNPKIYIDGNQWCVLYGESIQEGVCGFGDSPHQAVIDFNKSWYEKLSTTQIKEIIPGTLDKLNAIGIKPKGGE